MRGYRDRVRGYCDRVRGYNDKVRVYQKYIFHVSIENHFFVSAQYLKNEMSDLNDLNETWYTHAWWCRERRKLIDNEDYRTKVKVTTSKNRTKI